MIPIVLKIQTLKRHQPDHGRLLRSRSHLVLLKRLGDIRGSLLGRGTFARGGRVRARLRLGRDGLDLRCCDLHVSGPVILLPSFGGGGGGSWSRVAQGREDEEEESAAEMGWLHFELRCCGLYLYL